MTAASNPHNPLLAIEQKIVGDIYTATTPMDNLIILCDDFGSRFGGTEMEHQAAEFLAAKLTEYGLSNVRTEKIEFTGWNRGEVSLEIISPIQKNIPCITLPHAPPADLEGTIIDLGDGHPDDIEAQAQLIKGNIAMTTSHIAPKGIKRWVHRSEKYNRSALAGATGFIFINHYPGYGPATGSIGEGGKAPIPGISISYEDAEFIRRLAKRKGPVQIRLKSTDSYEPKISYNVLGDLPGTADSPQVVMLGSHYDGHDIAQGAGDPASGAVSVLEAARVLAKYAPNLPHTLTFALWGIEEIGLLGSRHYVKTHYDELDQLRFYFNVDSAGVLVMKDIQLNEWPSLEPIFAQWRAEMAQTFALEQSVMAFSDHYPFFRAGVPTGALSSIRERKSGRGYGHTHFDTVDKLTLESLREASALSARVVLRAAHAVDWPVERRPVSEVEALLDSPAYREEKELEARARAFYEEKGLAFIF